MSLRIAIVNVADGFWYPRGQMRLKHTMQEYAGMELDFLFWANGTYPQGSASHQQIPYQFKPYAIQEAIDRNFDIALWCDSSVFCKKNITPIIKQIQKDGHLFFWNGWKSGEWLCDNQLAPLGITREEAMEIPHMMAAVMGFDLRNERTQEFIHLWKGLSPHFKGSWTRCQECSTDDRVLGSRHDQAFASVISYKMGMNWTDIKPLISYDVNEDTILAAQGM